MDEWVWIRAFPANEYGRAIDVLLTLKALEPIQLSGRKEKGYSGFGLRYGPRQGTIITTPQGIESADSDLKRFPWADESGKFAGSSTLSGTAIFQHPTNPSVPAGWCLRDYGFIGVSWPGVEIVNLEPGKRADPALPRLGPRGRRRSRQSAGSIQPLCQAAGSVHQQRIVAPMWRCGLSRFHESGGGLPYLPPK